MAKESKGQKETVGRVMHEFKHGELETGTGRPVKSDRAQRSWSLEPGKPAKKQAEFGKNQEEGTRRGDRQAGKGRTSLAAERKLNPKFCSCLYPG